MSTSPGSVAAARNAVFDGAPGANEPSPPWGEVEGGTLGVGDVVVGRLVLGDVVVGRLVVGEVVNLDVDQTAWPMTTPSAAAMSTSTTRAAVRILRLLGWRASADEGGPPGPAPSG
jgi:hypothetical protein